MWETPVLPAFPGQSVPRELSSLPRFKYGEVVRVIDEDAPEKPGRQKAIELSNLKILLCHRRREERHIVQPERSDFHVLRGENQVRGLPSIASNSLERLTPV